MEDEQKILSCVLKRYYIIFKHTASWRETWYSIHFLKSSHSELIYQTSYSATIDLAFWAIVDRMFVYIYMNIPHCWCNVRKKMQTKEMALFLTFRHRTLSVEKKSPLWWNVRNKAISPSLCFHCYHTAGVQINIPCRNHQNCFSCFGVVFLVFLLGFLIHYISFVQWQGI